jgi:hypothetical protein
MKLDRKFAANLLFGNMTAARLSSIALLTLGGFLAGCYVRTELCVTNRTGTGIYVYSGHTKNITTINAGATGVVPHTMGSLIVITQQDDVWEYDEVQSIVAEAYRGHKRVSLRVDIGPDGVITLPSGRKLEPTQRIKPKR